MAWALRNLNPFRMEDNLGSLLRVIKKDYQHTPDILNLEMGKHWWVFEYGECMQGHREHNDWIDGDFEGQVEFFGAGFTKYQNLIMYKKDIGAYSYPIIMPFMPNLPKKHSEVHSRQIAGRIKGELYLVQGADAIMKLDILRQNGVAFIRVRMPILFPYTKSVWNPKTQSYEATELMEMTPAWVYLGIKKYWDGILDNGYSSHLVQNFRHTGNNSPYAQHVMGDYYFYSKLETLHDEERNGGTIL